MLPTSRPVAPELLPYDHRAASRLGQTGTENPMSTLEVDEKYRAIRIQAVAVDELEAVILSLEAQPTLRPLVPWANRDQC